MLAYICRAGHETVGMIDVRQVYEIAKIKKEDEHLKNITDIAMCRSIVATAKSIGLQVVGGK